MDHLEQSIGSTKEALEFYGKNYVTNTNDHVIIKNIYYKDLILPELFEFSIMYDNNLPNLTNVIM